MSRKIVSFDTNADRIATKLLALAPKAFAAIKQGTVVGMEIFGGKAIKEQMSGRAQGDIFLNTGSGGGGGLKGSWNVTTRAEGNDFIVNWGSRSPYAAIHQFGGLTGRNHASVIPKRLFLIERFKSTGTRVIVVTAQRRLRQALAKI